MTDVVKSKTQIISTPADARALYAPPAANFTGMVGLEVEMALYRKGADKPSIPTAREVTQLQQALKAKGFDAQLEAAGVLEYASPPARLEDTAALVEKVKADLETFQQAAAKAGFVRAPFCVLPTTSTQDALDNRVSRERLETSLAVLADVLGPKTVNIPLLTTGVQTSFSPANEQEMFAMAKRAYALTPLLIAAMNSSSGFVENDPARKDVHIRSKYYEVYGAAGGIAQSFLQAQTAEDFIDNHIKAVFTTPMFFAYDKTGALIRSTKEDVLTFEKLAARGLNTLSNYELAESFIYNDVKICNLRDETGAVVGKRLEVRAADSGLHQPIDTLLLTAALVPSGATAEKFEAVLKEYGFTGNPKTDAPLLKAAHAAAVNHDGAFMDVAFGTGRLRDFAADVAGLVVAHYDGQKTLSPDVAKLAELLLTGACDAKAHKQTYATLQEVAADLQSKALPVNDNRPAPMAKRTPRKFNR